MGSPAGSEYFRVHNGPSSTSGSTTDPEDSAMVREDSAMVREDSARVRQDSAMVRQDLARVRQDSAGSGKPEASGRGVRPGLEGASKRTFSRNARDRFPGLRGTLGALGAQKKKQAEDIIRTGWTSSDAKRGGLPTVCSIQRVGAII